MRPLSMVRTRSIASLTPPTTSRAGVPPAPGLEQVPETGSWRPDAAGAGGTPALLWQTLLARADSPALAGPRAPFHKTNKTTKESK